MKIINKLIDNNKIKEIVISEALLLFWYYIPAEEERLLAWNL
jgi:hypothetical protein